MSSHPLSDEQKKLLLQLARDTIECYARGGTLPDLDISQFPPELLEDGATFVTLTTGEGDLRGCVGALEAYQPLVKDVCEHALAAACDDFRFSPVTAAETADLKIEISRLTPPQRLEYRTPAELVERLRPGVDGVILRDGLRRATFLPQVWEKLPDAESFLNHLCQKMGAPAGLWRKRLLNVQVYQVEEFCEA